MTPAWLARPLAGVPLRIKLTLAFTGVMAVLLAAAGIALSVLVARNLDRAINAGLEARAGDAAALVGGDIRRGRLQDGGETYAQVLGHDGRVLDTTPKAGEEPLLSAAEVREANVKTLIVDRAKDSEEAAVRLY